MVSPHVEGKRTVAVRNAGDSLLELYFLDEIENKEYYNWYGEEVETNLLAEIMAQVKMYQPTRIICYIDTIGGDLNLAFGIYNFLKNYNAKVETEVISLALSAGLVLVQMASKGKRRMPAGGFLMAHAPSLVVSGTAKELEQAVLLAGQYEDQVANVLATNNTAGKTAEEIKALWQNGDCWMTGQQALEMGFVDELYNNDTVTQKVTNKAKTLTVKNREQLEALVNNTPVPAAEENNEEAEEGLHTNTINKIVMDITNSLKALFSKKEEKPTVTNTATVAALEPFITEVGNTIQTEVTNALDSVRGEVTALRETEITNLKNELDNLRNEINSIKGRAAEPKPANSGGKSDAAGIFKFNGK